MSEPLRVTLVTQDPGLAAAFAALVAQEPETELIVETKQLETMAWAGGPTPHVVIAVDSATGGAPLDVIARLHALPRFAHSRFLLARPHLGPEDGVAEINHGVHDFLTLPLVPAEVIARLRSLADHQRLHVALGEEHARIDNLHSAFHTGFDQIIRLLLRLVDMHAPGAESRGASAATLALQVASRFRIPERFLRDLELAARLYEVGRMALVDDDGDTENDRARRHALNPGAASLASRALLEDVDGLKGVAEVLSAVYENWDGTGVPERAMQGQIPLRSRILRVAIDYLRGVEDSPKNSEAVLERMEIHSGTHYDPLVLAHLHAALSEDGGPVLEASSRHLPIEKLRVGMVLAEDLYTDNGLKLLKGGTALSPSSLDTILRRHRMEPILRGAMIEPLAA